MPNENTPASFRSPRGSGRLCRLPLHNQPANSNSALLHMPVEIPLNTGVPAGGITYETFQVLDSISFVDFKEEVCQRMGINADSAVLGYKFPRDTRSGDWHSLTDENQLRFAIRRGREYISHARKYPERVKLQIKNMVSLFVVEREYLLTNMTSCRQIMLRLLLSIANVAQGLIPPAIRLHATSVLGLLLLKTWPMWLELELRPLLPST